MNALKRSEKGNYTLQAGGALTGLVRVTLQDFGDSTQKGLAILPKEGWRFARKGASLTWFLFHASVSALNLTPMQLLKAVGSAYSRL
jgi:hypothetical protein